MRRICFNPVPLAVNAVVVEMLSLLIWLTSLALDLDVLAVRNAHESPFGESPGALSGAAGSSPKRVDPPSVWIFS